MVFDPCFFCLLDLWFLLPLQRVWFNVFWSFVLKKTQILCFIHHFERVGFVFFFFFSKHWSFFKSLWSKRLLFRPLVLFIEGVKIRAYALKGRKTSVSKGNSFFFIIKKNVFCLVVWYKERAFFCVIVFSFWKWNFSLSFLGLKTNGVYETFETEKRNLWFFCNPKGMYFETLDIWRALFF